MAYTLPVDASPATLGAIELTSIARGFRLVDLMFKKAPIEVIDARAVCPGKFLIVISGDLGSVEEAIALGRDEAGPSLFGDILIPNLSPMVVPAINRTVGGGIGESLGIVESFSAVSAIDAADFAIKSADIQIESIVLLDGIGGKAFVIVSGLLPDVQAAMDAAETRVPEEMIVGTEIVPQFSPEILRFLPGRDGGLE